MMDAINDEFWDIRKFTLQNLDLKRYNGSEEALGSIGQLALHDPVAQVRRFALVALADLNETYAFPIADSLFMNDSSRMVKAIALGIIYPIDKTAYYKKAGAFSTTNNHYLKNQIANIYAEMGGKKDHAFFKRVMWSMRPYMTNILMDNYMEFLKRMDPATIEEATTFLLDMALYEESETIQNGARNALYDLHDHFSKIGGAGAESLKKAVDNLD